jgi:hypothetical protein
MLLERVLPNNSSESFVGTSALRMSPAIMEICAPVSHKVPYVCCFNGSSDVIMIVAQTNGRLSDALDVGVWHNAVRERSLCELAHFVALLGFRGSQVGVPDCGDGGLVGRTNEALPTAHIGHLGGWP